MNTRRSQYRDAYFRLIQNASSRNKPECYCERHHIVPKCIGGSDEIENLVWLTAREHLVAHKLWARMEDDPVKKRKAFNALWAMTVMRGKHNAGRKVVSSREYEIAKLLMITARTGVKRSDTTKNKIAASLKQHFAKNGCHNKGKKFDHLSSEQKSMLFGRGNKGRIQTEEEKQKRAEKLRKPRTPQAKENIRLGALKREAKKRALKASLG